MTLYDAIISSCAQRSDFYLTGLANYYARLLQLQLESKGKPLDYFNQAIDTWNQLAERPAQYVDVHGLIKNLENIQSP